MGLQLRRKSNQMASFHVTHPHHMFVTWTFLKTHSRQALYGWALPKNSSGASKNLAVTPLHSARFSCQMIFLVLRENASICEV